MENGKRKAYYSRISADHAEALKAGTARLSTPIDDTFHELAVCYWLPSLETRKPNTKRRYADIYKRYIYPTFGHRDPKTVRHSEVQAWANALGKAAASVVLSSSVLKQIFSAFEREGVVSINPARNLRLPKIERRERVMSIQDMKRLLSMTEGTPLACPVFLAGVLGLRRGEVCGLRWSSIDMESRRIHITEQRLIEMGDKRGKGTKQAPLKTSSSRRSFILPKPLWDALMRVADLDALHVATRRGKPWNPEHLTCEWAAERARLGFADWHFHDLRHGAAGILVALGVHPVTVASILGQKHLDTTQLYMAIQDETATKGLEKVSKALFSVEKRQRKVSR